MKQRIATVIAAFLAAAGAATASAQQPAPPAAAPSPPPPAFAAPNLTESGVRSIAAQCAMCHGPNGKPSEGSSVPGLAGRPAAELVGIMNQFKAGTRPATIMHQIAKGYGDAETAATADYFSKQR